MGFYFSLLLLILSVLFHNVAVAHKPTHTTRFEDGEHRVAANGGYITMVDEAAYDATGVVTLVNFTAEVYNFTNLRGTELYTYGDIVGFAGDFFGPMNELSIICTASSGLEARNLFYKAFLQLWNTTDSGYIARIRKEMQREIDAINANPDMYPYKVFAKLPESRWAKVFPSNVELGLLLTNNLDHFSSCAVFAYFAGHTFALEMAAQASNNIKTCGNITDVTEKSQCMKAAFYLLETAYAMNAFSDHYLTDLFASGHIRTPRRLITMACFPQTSLINSFLGASSAGGLASQWMHDEDNRNGLLVTNKRGDVWTAYGDDNYFGVKDARNRVIIAEAVQMSRDEVILAFILGNTSSLSSYSALQLIPDSSQLSLFASNNTCPLFYVDEMDGGVVMVRQQGQIRPDSWRTNHGFPGDPFLNSCNYTAFTYEQCPHAVLSKIENELPAWVSTAYTQKLVYSDEDQAWITQRPDYMAYSNKPLIIFSVAGFLLAVVMSFSFLSFEFFYTGFGRCHPKLQKDGLPKGIVTCCLGVGGWQLAWIFSTALFPTLLTCILGLLVFGVIFVTMPDMYYTVPKEAWIAFFVIGFMVAFFSRFFLYNWYNYFRYRNARKRQFDKVTNIESIKHGDDGDEEDSRATEITPMLNASV